MAGVASLSKNGRLAFVRGAACEKRYHVRDGQIATVKRIFQPQTACGVEAWSGESANDATGTRRTLCSSGQRSQTFIVRLAHATNAASSWSDTKRQPAKPAVKSLRSKTDDRRWKIQSRRQTPRRRTQTSLRRDANKPVNRPHSACVGVSDLWRQHGSQRN